MTNSPRWEGRDNNDSHNYSGMMARRQWHLPTPPLAHLNCYDRPTMTPPRATACGVDPYPSPDDDDAMSSSSSAPVIKGACNCRSPQMQELIYDGRWQVDLYLPDLWVVGTGTGMLKSTCGLPVWIPKHHVESVLLHDVKRDFHCNLVEDVGHSRH
jgi:hypothetical protein